MRARREVRNKASGLRHCGARAYVRELGEEEGDRQPPRERETAASAHAVPFVKRLAAGRM
jgi:hypothetical protein